MGVFINRQSSFPPSQNLRLLICEGPRVSVSSELKKGILGRLLSPCYPPLALLWKPLSLLTLAGEGGRAMDRAPGTEGWIKIHELFDEFSLLGELEEEEEDDDEKFMPVSPGGFVAVFCPLKLFRHTGHVSCCSSQGTMQLLWNR